MGLKLLTMKNILYSFFFLLLSIHSNAQKKTVHKASSKSNRMMIPNMAKDDVELPDLGDLIAKENKKILEKTNDSTQLLNRNAKELTFDENGLMSFYREGKLVRFTKITKDTIQKPIPVKQAYREWRDEYKQSMQTAVDFYPDGKVRVIKHFNNTSNGYYPAGNWYVYDSDGKLLGHIDHEKYFKSSYYDLAMIADTYDYRNVTIGRAFGPKGFAYWVFLLEKYGETKILIIDDKTRKILYDMNWYEYRSFRKFDDIIKYVEELHAPFKTD